MVAGEVVGGTGIAQIEFAAFVIRPIGIAAHHFSCSIFNVNPIRRKEWNGICVCEGAAKSHKTAWKTGVGIVNVAPDVV